MCRTSYTNVIDYARQLKRLMGSRGWSIEEAAERLDLRSITYLRQRQSLLNLDNDYQMMLKDGALNHEIAFLVARMSSEDQTKVKDKVLGLTLSEFEDYIKVLGINVQ